MISHHRDTEDTENASILDLSRCYQDKSKPQSAIGEQSCSFSICDMDIDDLTGTVIGAAIEVHKTLGPGLLESTYEECLCVELGLRKISFERQKELPVEYKHVKLDCGYRIDVLVANRLILELKACESLQPIHEAQLLTYLRPVSYTHLTLPTTPYV